MLDLQCRCRTEWRRGDRREGCGGCAQHRSSSAVYLERLNAHPSRRESAVRSQWATWCSRRAALSDMWPRGWRLLRRVDASHDSLSSLRFPCASHTRARHTHSIKEINHAQNHPAGNRRLRMEKDAIPHPRARSRSFFGFLNLTGCWRRPQLFPHPVDGGSRRFLPSVEGRSSHLVSGRPEVTRRDELAAPALRT